MKYAIIIILAISIASCSSGNHRTRTERMEDNNTKMSIEDDGRTMSMKVKIKNTENPIDYAESFDVKNMSDKQKEKLKNRILDSLYALK